MSRLRLLALLAVPAAAALVPAVPVGAATTTTFVVRPFADPDGVGLPVTAPLSQFVVGSRARVTVPTRWQRLSAPAGSLRLRTTQNPSCHFTMTYRVKTVLGATQEAAARVTAALPAPGAGYVLDAGTHGNRAFRVVRQRSVAGRIRIDALWAGVLTRRADIAPGGQTAWTEIRVSVSSAAGDECHAGTYRSSLGPTLGDTLAVARTSLHFTKVR
jgi:hypothetical protein